MPVVGHRLFSDMDEERSVGAFEFDLSNACRQIVKSVALPDGHPFTVSRKKPLRKSEILEILTQLVTNPKHCKQVARFCKPIIAEIVGEASKDASKKGENLIELGYAISILILEYPFLCEVAEDFFPLLKTTRMLKEMHENQTEMLIETFVNLLNANADKFFMVVDWNLVGALLEKSKQNYDAIRCVALAADYCDLSKFVPEAILKDLLNIENECGANGKDECLPPDVMDAEAESFDNLFGEIFFTGADIRSNLIPIAGLLLPTKHKISQIEQKLKEFVITSGSLTNVQSLAFSIMTRTPVLLEGELGSGKTSLLDYFAFLMGKTEAPAVLKLQLGDQTDSKSMLGIYVCTETPGEFKWQAGTLTKAVRNGSWLILEDIDSAPLDVISVLIPLLEGKPLSIPGQSKAIIPTPGFQIFMTRRLHKGVIGNYHQNFPSKSIEHLCTKIHLESMSKEELLEIVCKKHPHLEAIAAKLVDVYCMISSDLNLKTANDTTLANLPAIKRQSTARDFFKWCRRVAERFQSSALISVNHDVFQEAFSCFCIPVGHLNDRLTLAHAIGSKLGVTKDKVDFYVLRNKAAVQQTPLTLSVGRSSLIKKEMLSYGMKSMVSAKYAFTRHSLNLLEQISICVSHNEPVLLVGETGCGKTSTIQYLATQCGHRFEAINMSQQSDVTDLLGGFKPVDFKQMIAPLREKFEDLFVQTFSQKQNVKFLGHIQQCFAEKKWEILLKLMAHCKRAALRRKGLKKGLNDMEKLMSNWNSFGLELKKILKQLHEGHSLAFAFIEGTLIKAIKCGEWILLDEINLATAETLECLSGLLESRSGSVVLVERGDAEPVRRHEDFRLFACMNPATDVGKKDLPFGIRNRFTEIYVDELNDIADLKVLVSHYLQHGDVTSRLVDGIVRFYQLIQQEAKDKLTDGTGHRPHYSLRTLCRALEYVTRNANMMLPKAIYEGFCLSFLTQLDRSSHPTVEAMIRINILGHLNNINSLLSQPIPCPGRQSFYCQVEGYWIEKGEMVPAPPQEYVLTMSVKENLRDLARVVSGRNYPVLLQGETSVGKTSLITYLAKSTGNQCVRINNHEHTDIQEYIGCYSADENGKLVFKDGLLVDAMRKGYWIILDELNLAPTDVLEALNRLLDDNRELFIAETQETIKAHPKFMLFATQNPPGQYGGRKILSRAFRNRFVELHFDEIPSNELQIILHKRCHLPRSYCNKFVAVMQSLQARRKSSGIFAGKHGFITLRDLFRWAERYRQTPSEELQSRFYDWDQHIAEDGYMLLAGRCRKPDESSVIQETIERIMKRKINLETLYKTGSLTTSNLLQQLFAVESNEFKHLVWTGNLQRMAVLVGRAIQFNEPVLLVGETGCGKTTVCQLFSHLRKSKLYSVNCHMHTESSDFIGGLRPVRQRDQESDETKLFEWNDGPLVTALKDGSSFLIDEISLADDSVLERLNSVLETEKTLVVAEKGGSDNSNEDEIEVIVADPKFRLMATMNPGGDFGKKELSPALRNRFTEIWCPQSEDREDFIRIIEHNINFSAHNQSPINGRQFGEMMTAFIDWFSKTEAGQRMTISIRDFLSWSNFIKKTCTHDVADDVTTMLSPQLAYIHGAFLVFVDAIGSGSSWSGPAFSLERARQSCLSFLKSQVSLLKDESHHEFLLNHPLKFGILPFVITRGPLPALTSESTGSYSLKTKTTSENTLRLLRALQLDRPILLEGSPGVGKTSLVTALAKFSGNQLTRINLSEQTDVTDLFGADLPVEGGKGGEFAWSNGPFLKALKQGQWIVLDELNLASQSVLEGLNACFDHRGEIYVPELGKSFQVQHNKTRIFACQNPLSQGGGRKGLPKSFLNRFTKVYIEHLKEGDLLFIINASYPGLDNNVLTRMIQFNSEMQRKTMVTAEWGRKGSPWEFNVRDILRWCELINRYQDPRSCEPSEFLNLIYTDRMRTTEDKEKVFEMYSQIFQDDCIWKRSANRKTQFSIGPNHLQVGNSILPRTNKNVSMPQQATGSLRLLRKQIPYIESVMKCIEMNWMTILVGPKACGKTRIIETIAELTGNTLDTLAMNSNMDTTEMLGGFEQVNLGRHLDEIFVRIESLIGELLRNEIDIFQSISSSDSIQIMLDMKRRLKNLECKGVQTTQDVDDESVSVTEKFKIIDDIIHDISEIAGKKESFITVIDEIKQTFDALKIRFEKEGKSLHAKGQFEWVDGILVEALKRGTWLLIDNVNFCSPSVLDRLNGLLEPNGVLSIDERGVQNNDIPTVKPHPNFRLFLAMDPKHGEISRAMRNRGIEIYIIGEDEGMPFTTSDKLELISSVGLKDEYSKSMLISIHAEILKIFPHTVTELVKASRLTKQIVDRGFTTNEALKLACTNVFAGYQILIDEREKILPIIDNFTNASSNQCLIENEGERTFFGAERIKANHVEVNKYLSENRLLLPSVAEFSRFSTLSRIRRDGIFLEHLRQSPHDWGFVFMALKAFLERSSVDDWFWRLQMIAKVIEREDLKSDQVNSYHSLSIYFRGIFERQIFGSIRENMKKIAAALPHHPQIAFEISYDLRLNRRLLQDAFLAAEKNQEMKSILEVILSLYNRFKFLLQRSSVNVMEIKIQDVAKNPSRPSLLEVSKQFVNGSLPSSKLPHPVVELFHPYFKILGNLLDEALQQSSSPFTDELFQKLLFSLQWRDHFWLLCAQSVVELQKKTHFHKSLYAIHWKWIEEELNPVLAELFSTENSTSLKELERFINAISARFSEDLPGNWVNLDSSRMRKPSPYKSHDVFSIWSILEAFENELSFFKHLQQEKPDECLKTLFMQDSYDKRSSLFQCLVQYFSAAVKGQMNMDEISTLQKSISMSIEPHSTDSEMTSNAVDTKEKRTTDLTPELWLIYGQINMFAWLNIIQATVFVDRDACRSATAIGTLEKRLTSLTKLVHFQDSKDSKLLAMMSTQLEQLKEKLISKLPGHSLPTLRSHFHEISTFELQRKLLDVMNKSNDQFSQAEESFKPFSSIATTVLIPWACKRLMVKSTTSLTPPESIDHFDWKISVKEINKTQSLLTSLLSFSWTHGGLLQQLPHKLMRGTFQDTIRILIDLISTIQMDSLIDEEFLSALDDGKSFYNVLDVLVKKLKSDVMNNADLPFNMKHILVTIGMFAEKELAVAQSYELDEHDLFMRKVQFLGETMVCVGMCRFLLNIPRNPYDIAEEAKLKCHYFDEEVDAINKELDFRFSVEESLCGVSKPKVTKYEKIDVEHYTSNESRVKLLLQRRDYLIKQINQLKDRIALRPNPSQYDLLVKDLMHFHNNVTNHTTLLGMLLNLNDALHTGNESGKSFPRNLQRRVKIWISSTKQFVQQLEKNYPLYPDIILPIKWSLMQIVSGFSFSLSVTDWQITRHDFKQTTHTSEVLNPAQICKVLVTFPMSAAKELTLPSETAACLLSQPFAQGIEALFGKQGNFGNGATARILHLALSHLCCDVVLRGHQFDISKTNLSKVVNGFYGIWLNFSEEERMKEAEVDAMYRFKSRTHCTESDDTTQNEKSFKDFFPTFRRDYHDLIPKDSLNDEDNDNIELEEEVSTSEGDLSSNMAHVNIGQIYQNLKTIINAGVDRMQLTEENLAGIFLNSYKEFLSLASLDAIKTDPLLDCQLTSSNLLLTSLLKKSLDFKTTDASAKFDIYHENNVIEVQKLLPLLGRFSSRVLELLDEFPEHPALLQIQQIIDRILSFPVNQPLMKFLTGLEILLRQAQDWESYASSRVSIKSQLQDVTDQIIEWRKLELKCWPHLLQVVEKKFEKDAEGWFLKISSALDEVRHQSHENQDEETATKRNFAKLLQGFIESSSIGEYQARLELINVLYKSMEEDDQGLAAVLWNIFNYYKQFDSTVNDAIRNSKTCIEKDLKDFVKIAKWKDVNFYAMKQAAEKSHRTLHKFVRRFEEFLSSPVIGHLRLVNGEPSTSDAHDSRIKLPLDSFKDWSRFITPKAVVNLDPQVASNNGWLKGASKLTSRFAKKCSKYLRDAKHHSMIETLDEFTGDVIANVKELQSVEILSLPQDKRSNARKNLDLRKRKALATLYKTLTNMGLSYRKGIAISSQHESDLHILSPVLQCDNHESQSDSLSSLKRDCHMYYFKCLARQSALHQSLRSPSKELNPQDIARSKGFTEHLYALVQNQRKNLVVLNENYQCIRSKALALGKIINENTDKTSLDPKAFVPSQTNSINNTGKLKDLVDLTIYIMKQFNMLVKCCPESSKEETLSFAPQDELTPISQCSLDDERMQTVVKATETILENSLSSKLELDKVFHKSVEDDCSFLFSWKNRSLLDGVISKMESNCTLFAEIENLFALPRDSAKESLARSVYWLRIKTRKILNELDFSSANQDADSNRSDVNEDFGTSVEHIFKGILTCIQELFQMQNSKDDEEQYDANKSNVHDAKDVEDLEDLDDLELMEGHLIPNLDRNFFDEMSKLKSTSVSANLSTLFQEMRSLFDIKDDEGNDLRLIYPIIEQYSRVIEYFLEKLLHLHRTTCKLLFVLSGIFTDLATQGFCLPPDEVETSGEGATEFEDIQSGGIGEGEGMKDVSDQIEDESQLQGAEQEGKEKEEKPDEDRNIPNEEQGIEMSDDFDGRLHDVDPDEEGKEEESDEEKDEEEEQADDKMGQLDGMEEEKFDEKFWGDSDEEDDNEADDENDKGAGADGQAESELVAKDENEGEQKGEEREKQSGNEEASEEINELSPDEISEDENEKDIDEKKNNEEVDNKEREGADDDFADDLEFKDEDLENEDMKNEDLENEDFENEDLENEPSNDENKAEEENVDNDVIEGEQETADEGNEDEMNNDDEKSEEDEKENIDDGQNMNDKDIQGEDAMEEEDDHEKADDKGGEHDIEAEPSAANDNASLAPNASLNEPTSQEQNTMDEQSEENQGHGSSQQEGSEGHSGISSVTQKQPDGPNEKKNRKKDYNRSRQDRSLADDIEQKLKRLKTEDRQESTQKEEETKKTEKQTSDLYQHIQGDDDYDAHTLDAATFDQTKSQLDMEKKLDDSDIEMDNEEESDAEEEPNADKQMTEADDTATKKAKNLKEQLPGDDDHAEDSKKDEPASTEEPMVDDGNETKIINSGFFTSKEALIKQFDDATLEFDSAALRKDLEQNLASWVNTRQQGHKDDAEAVERWRKYESLTSPLSQQLCEQLRLVLEPTMASKLKGDYRTGKRLNMRKVISYIASQFRKDKIWLRRTKKSRRQYQILLAVDDSSSMGDNHSKQLAFESLAVISNALTWLEAGELAVCSFGETTKLLHSFKEPFNEEAGAHILCDFTFEQKKTHIAKMLDTCSSFMSKERSNVLKSSSNRIDTSQLLLIVSDGRGIFLEGKEVVERSVRRAREAGIFIVFIILDNPSNRDSILDIRIPIFKSDGGFPEIKSYIEEFPFPFYMILRDINSLPIVLSDALRQWFELVINVT